MRLSKVVPLLALAAICAGACDNRSADRRETDAATDERPFKKRTVRIVARSTPPDPETAPYRDCLFTATAEVLEPQRYRGESVQIAFWAFRDRTWADSAFLEAGTETVVKLLPYAGAAEVASIQLVDEVCDFDNPLFFAADYQTTRAAQARPVAARSAPEPDYDLDAQFEMLAFLRDRLAGRGIRLLLVPFPFRQQVDPSYPFEDPEYAKFVELRSELLQRLRRSEIDLVDLTGDLRAAGGAGKNLYYEGENDHPAADALEIAAARVARHLLDAGLAKPRAAGTLAFRKVAFSRAPQYRARQVLSPDGRPIELDQPSPLLVLSDSYGRYPQDTPFGSIPSANFAAQLALEIEPTPRSFSQSSGGAVMPAALARRPELLDGVEVCIFLFSPYYAWVAGGRMWEKVEF